MFLMNREAPDDPLPAPPTQEQIERHQSLGDNSGPTLDFFRIDYNAKATSQWNRAATVVFLDTFLETPDCRRYFQHEAQARENEDDFARKLRIKATKKEVQRTFRKHFHSLRKKWAKQNKYHADSDAHVIDKSSAARDRRRREVSLTLMYDSYPTASTFSFTPDVEFSQKMNGLKSLVSKSFSTCSKFLVSTE